jgi:hypothetical protein
MLTCPTITRHALALIAAALLSLAAAGGAHAQLLATHRGEAAGRDSQSVLFTVDQPTQVRVRWSAQALNTHGHLRLVLQERGVDGRYRTTQRLADGQPASGGIGLQLAPGLYRIQIDATATSWDLRVEGG